MRTNSFSNGGGISGRTFSLHLATDDFQKPSRQPTARSRRQAARISPFIHGVRRRMMAVAAVRRSDIIEHAIYQYH